MEKMPLDQKIIILLIIAFVPVLGVVLFGGNSSASIAQPKKPAFSADYPLGEVTVRVSNKQTCPSGMPFEIINATMKTVNSVHFKVFGTIAGRSTKYELTPVNAESDYIMKPGEIHQGCVKLDYSQAPAGEKLAVNAEVIWTDDQD